METLAYKTKNTRESIIYSEDFGRINIQCVTGCRHKQKPILAGLLHFVCQRENTIILFFFFAHQNVYISCHSRYFKDKEWGTVPGLRSVIPQPPPPAPVSLLWSPRASVTRHNVSKTGCPTPMTFRWCWFMSMSS